MDTTTSPGPLHCANCGELLARNPRLGGRQQRYCGKPACQRARKTGWQRRKYAADAAYREREKKRVRVFRRTHRIRSCRGQPPAAGVNTAGTARSFTDTLVSPSTSTVIGPVSAPAGITTTIWLAPHDV